LCHKRPYYHPAFTLVSSPNFYKPHSTLHIAAPFLYSINIPGRISWHKFHSNSGTAAPTPATSTVVSAPSVSPTQDAPIMRWLSPLELRNRHQGVCTERSDGLGNWLVETTEFREWRCSVDGAGKVLFCSGNPGVSKTYLR